MQILRYRNIFHSCQLYAYREKKRKMIRFCHLDLTAYFICIKQAVSMTNPNRLPKIKIKVIFDKSATGGQPMVSLTSQWIVVIHNKFTNHWPSPDAHIGEYFSNTFLLVIRNQSYFSLYNDFVVYIFFFCRPSAPPLSICYSEAFT